MVKIQILLTAFLVFTSSCSSKNSNTLFQKRYGKEAKKINFERIPSKEVKNEVISSSPPSAEELAQIDNSGHRENRYTYVDVDKMGYESVKKFLPDGDYYEQMKIYNPSNSLPSEMFEVSYNTDLYSGFRKVGAEFDKINIPKSDAHGVATSMSEKPYFLVGNSSLQKNIDQVNSTRSKTDVEISKILIREQREINQKLRMIKDFGEDLSDLVVEKKNINKKSEKTLTGLLDKFNIFNSSKTTEPRSGFVRTVIKN